MDIELRTHASNPSLALHNLERRAENSPQLPAGWRATLVVRSGPFAGELPFYFDDYGVQLFISCLREMDRTLIGAATLSTPNEDPYIQFTMGSGGLVDVSGVLLIYDVPMQRLEFAFVTDQTVLDPLATDFEQAQRMLAEARA